MKLLKQITIAGGSGFIGTALAEHHAKHGIEVVILTRNPQKYRSKIKYMYWDGENIGPWIEHLNHSQILINMAGRTVNCRYNEENKRQIMDSRVDSTKVLQKAMKQCSTPPNVWLNSSTATIYKGSQTHINTENDGILGNDFSMSVAQNWENEFFKQDIKGVRKVALRTSLVLDKNGSVIPILSKLVKFGVGGHMGDGKQKFAHLSLSEFIRMVDFIIENEELSGPVNCTSTLQITNHEFMKYLRRKLNKKLFINQTKWMVDLGSWLMRTESELILKSRFVYPQKLEDHGFKFNPDLEEIWK